MPRNTFEPGTVLRVDLDHEWHTYARTLERAPKLAFYDCRVSTPVEDVRVVLDRSVLFVLAVSRRYANRWPKVGWFPVDTAPVAVPDQFMQDVVTGGCELIDADGNIRPATPRECAGLERAAVWNPDDIEERLRDHYAGRANPHVEHLKVSL